MIYTTSEKADKKIGADLEKIKKVLIEEFNPISIILFGGFGRGEGTYEIVDGKIIPLNDYDLYIVTKKKIFEERIEEVGEKCSKLLNKGGKEFVGEYNEIYDKKDYFHVDLRWLDYNKLGKMKRINRTYELKYGSTVIYGEDVRNKINDVKIPLSESFRYLTNPAGHLILCMDERRLKGDFKKDEKFYLLHHIVKTYLALASSLIISDNKFEPNYTRTVEKCKEIYKDKFPDLIKKIEWALDLKLSPKNRDTKNIRKRWFEAIEDLTFVLGYISEKNWGIHSDGIIDLTRKLHKKLPYFYFAPYLPLPKILAKIAFPSQYFLNLLYFKRTGRSKNLFNWKDVGLKIALAGFLLLNARNDEKISEEAYSYIRTFAPLKNKTWEGLREGLLYGFDRYYSQKII